MANFWRPNLERRGRVMRGVAGLSLLAGGVAAWFWEPLVGVVLLASAAFVLLEAVRGWCVLRACGIKTRY
jgi:hypothetical protein